jgi:hypothetical protein
VLVRPTRKKKRLREGEMLKLAEIRCRSLLGGLPKHYQRWTA